VRRFLDAKIRVLNGGRGTELSQAVLPPEACQKLLKALDPRNAGLSQSCDYPGSRATEHREKERGV